MLIYTHTHTHPCYPSRNTGSRTALYCPAVPSATKRLALTEVDLDPTTEESADCVSSSERENRREEVFKTSLEVSQRRFRPSMQSWQTFRGI